MENMTISQFLVWLIGGGCVIASSWVLERIPAYTNLSPELKRWIFFGVSAVFGIGAYVISAYVPQPTLDAIAPYFTIIAGVFAYVFLGTGFHKIDKE